LDEHGVGSCSEEPLDLEVLLDAFEEQFDLPAGLVDVRDRAGSELEVIRQKNVCLAGLWVHVTDASQFAGILLSGIEPSESYLVIGSNTGGSVNAASLQDTILRVGLEPGNEAYRLGCQPVIEGKIMIAFVKNQKAASRDIHSPCRWSIMLFAVGENDESRDEAINLKKSVKLHSSLRLPEPCPGKYRETEFDECRIEDVEFAV